MVSIVPLPSLCILRDDRLCVLHVEFIFDWTNNANIFYFENSVNRSLYGNNYRRRGQGIESVVGLERQQRGSVHAHGLIRLPDHDATDPLQFSWRHWQKFASELGGWARLDIPRSNTDVVAYVTKYVVKDGDLVLGENFRPNAPKSYGMTIPGYQPELHP